MLSRDSSLRDVFISYARENADVARKLAAKLDQAGVTVWLDLEDLVGGDTWRDVTKRAIEKSRVFVPLFSNDFNSRRGFKDIELTHALSQFSSGKLDFKIIPARLEQCLIPSSLLQNIQSIDFFPSWDDGCLKLIRALRQNDEDMAVEKYDIIGFDLGHGETAIAKTLLRTSDEPKVLDVIGNKASIISAVAMTQDKGTVIGEEAFKVTGSENVYLYFKNIDVTQSKSKDPLKAFVQKCLETLLDDGKSPLWTTLSLL